MKGRRLARWLSGLWLGEALCVAFIAAPSAFAMLARADAGRFVGRLFELDAYVALAIGMVLLLLERRQRAPDVPAMSTNLLLIFGVLFCVVAGYFAVLPLMEQARAGQGSLSFAALHGISMAFFA